MKRIAWLIMVVCFVVTSSALAQYEDFDLSKFKLPEWKSHALSVTFSGSNSADADKDISMQADPTLEYNSNSLIYGRLTYSYNKNAKNHQRLLYTSMRLNYNSSRTDRNNNYYSSYSFSPDIYLNGTNRQYLNSRAFIETDLLIDINHRYSRNIHNEVLPDTTIYKDKDDRVYIPIKFGRGRIERVDDARRAIYILEALEKAERINVDIQDVDIIELATLISKLRSERVYDSRLTHTKHIEDLNTFLRSNGYIEQVDARYFTTLNDMWSYSYQDARYAGERISFAVRPGIYIDYERDPRHDMFERERYISLDVGMEYQYENPISLYWQESVEAWSYASINYLNRFRSNTSQEDKADYTSFNMGLVRHYTYYPNTRTELDLSYGACFASMISRNGEISINDSQLIQGLAAISMVYYISPKLSIRGEWRFDYVRAGNDWRLYQSYSLPSNGMNYYIANSDEMNMQSRINFQINYSIF
jgi:hypothetical protein